MSIDTNLQVEKLNGSNSSSKRVFFAICGNGLSSIVCKRCLAKNAHTTRVNFGDDLSLLSIANVICTTMDSLNNQAILDRAGVPDAKRPTNIRAVIIATVVQAEGDLSNASATMRDPTTYTNVTAEIDAGDTATPCGFTPVSQEA